MSDPHPVDVFAEALVAFYGAEAVQVVERQVALAEGASLVTWMLIRDRLQAPE